MPTIDDDPNFETILTADGRRVRVLRDGARHTVKMSVRDSASRLRVTDALGQAGQTGLGNRPGWRLPTNAYHDDQKIIAYDAYIRGKQQEYLGDRRSKKTKYNRSGDLEGTEEIEEESETHTEGGQADANERLTAAPAEGSPCTCRGEQFPCDQGAPGVIKNGICTPINPRGPKSLPRNKQDGLTVDQIAKNHAANMERIYRERDAEDKSAWRGGQS